jgi:hypothetical protein
MDPAFASKMGEKYQALDKVLEIEKRLWPQQRKREKIMANKTIITAEPGNGTFIA